MPHPQLTPTFPHYFNENPRSYTHIRADNSRVWLGCLSCYVEGRLVGRWVPVLGCQAVPPADLHDGEPTAHDEVIVFDYEGLPTCLGHLTPGAAGRWGERYAEVGPRRWGEYTAWWKPPARARTASRPAGPSSMSAVAAGGSPSTPSRSRALQTGRWLKAGGSGPPTSTLTSGPVTLPMTTTSPTPRAVACTCSVRCN